jgi:hypothetical protein
MRPRADGSGSEELGFKAVSMASNVETQQSPTERQWFIVGRWQEYEGEGRANLLRIIGIVLFYGVELVNYYGLNLGFLQMPQITNGSVHLAITILAVAWAVVAVGILVCRVFHFFPSSLKFLSTVCDILLLTCVLTVTDGPRSPMIIAYFVILALAALRFNLPLIWFATAGSAAGYLFLLGYARWFAEVDLRVPRYHQIVFLLGLVLTGVVLGQIIRRVRQLAEDYAKRVNGFREGIS